MLRRYWHPIAISTDGTQIAYVADRSLFRRSILDLESRLIVNAGDAAVGVSNPAFSPDGRSIAYVTVQDLTLRRVAVEGGTPVAICSLAALPNGVSWDPGGILFEADGAIMRVSTAGNRKRSSARAPAIGCAVHTCCRMGRPFCSHFSMRPPIRGMCRPPGYPLASSPSR